MDLIETLVKGTETMSERVEKLKKNWDNELQINSTKLLSEDVENEIEQVNKFLKYSKLIQESTEEEEDLGLRLDSGIGRFRESAQEFNMHELKHSSINRGESGRKIKDEEFKYFIFLI